MVKLLSKIRRPMVSKRASQSFEISRTRRILASLRRIVQPRWAISALQRGADAFFGFHRPDWLKSAMKVVAPPATQINRRDLYNPIYWIVWTCRFALIWVRTRPYTSLGPALPAIALSILLGGLVVKHRLQTEGAKSAAYRGLLNAALSEDDLTKASVAIGALIDIHPERTQYRFQRALIENELGNTEEATDMMNRLAASAGSAEAALWLITNEFDATNSSTWSPADHARFRNLVELALKDEKSSKTADARILMGRYLVSIGAIPEAISYFSTVVPDQPQLALPTALLCKEQNQIDRAKSFADIGSRYYRQQLEIAPSNVEHRISLARCLILLEQEEAASNLLWDGYSLTEDEVMRNASGEALVALANRLSPLIANSETQLQKMKILYRAVQRSPNSQIVLDATVQFLIECRENRHAEFTALRDAIVRGIDPETTHFIRGTLALMDGEFDIARTHLELAAQNSDSLPGVLNNLAVALSQSDNPDLATALKLSNAANDLLPDNAYLRDTRGQILLKLKRFPEAIHDLEFALSEKELGTPVHAALAEAYQALGNDELSEQHRKLAHD